MGVFRHPPPIFLGGAQPHAPRRKILPPAGEPAVGVNAHPFTRAWIQQILVGWDNPSFTPGDSSRDTVSEPTGVNAHPFTRPWLPAVAVGWKYGGF